MRPPSAEKFTAKNKYPDGCVGTESPSNSHLAVDAERLTENGPVRFGDYTGKKKILFEE